MDTGTTGITYLVTYQVFPRWLSGKESGVANRRKPKKTWV